MKVNLSERCLRDHDQKLAMHDKIFTRPKPKFWKNWKHSNWTADVYKD